MSDRAYDLGSSHDGRFARFAVGCTVVIVALFVVLTPSLPDANRPGHVLVAGLLVATLAVTFLMLRRGLTPRVLVAAGVVLMGLGIAVGLLLPANIDAAVVLPLAGAVVALPAARGRPLLLIMAAAFGASLAGEAIIHSGTSAAGSTVILDQSLLVFESGVMLAFTYGLLWWVGTRWWRADDRARRLLASQRRLLEVNERLLSTLDPEGVFELIADSLKSVVAFDNLTIYRVDRSAAMLRPVLARDRFAQLIIDSTFPLDRGITGWVVAHGRAECVNDTLGDPRATTIPGTPEEPEALIVVPLLVGGEVAGTLNVGRMGKDEAHFSDEEFELARLFAGQASIALRNAEALRAVEARAQTDALTGLLNRGAFDDELDRLIADHRIDPLFLVMLDLDGFKQYNDELGHPAGDALLQVAGRAIRASVRDGDLCFRYGGDEFALLLPRIDEESALQIAERVREAIAKAGSGGRYRVTASVGVSGWPSDARDPAALVAAADSALYRAKGLGGDRVELWSERPSSSGPDASVGAETRA
jgi:diguanylate cyclase (GGDEF)-like protein